MLCISAAYAVVWRLSARPSVRYVRVLCRNELTCLRRNMHLYTERYGNIPDGNPLTGAKITIFEQYLALGSMTAEASSVVNISIVEYGYSTQWRRLFIAADG